VRRVARPSLEALSKETEETVFLAIAHGDHVTYIDKVVSDRLIRMDAPLGVARPYNCTSVGKVLLSGMPDEKVVELSAAEVFECRTDNSILSIETLQAEIDQVRERGWAVDREEFALGAYCIGAPIYNHEGHVIAALTVSGPSERIKERLDDNVTKVVANAKKVSEAMGFRGN